MGHNRNLAVSFANVMFLDVRMDSLERIKAGLFRYGCREGG